MAAIVEYPSNENSIKVLSPVLYFTFFYFSVPQSLQRLFNLGTSCLTTPEGGREYFTRLPSYTLESVDLSFSIFSSKCWYCLPTISDHWFTIVVLSQNCLNGVRVPIIGLGQRTDLFCFSTASLNLCLITGGACNGRQFCFVDAGVFLNEVNQRGIHDGKFSSTALLTFNARSAVSTRYIMPIIFASGFPLPPDIVVVV